VGWLGGGEGPQRQRMCAEPRQRIVQAHFDRPVPEPYHLTPKTLNLKP
jgi:hypothetical protein